MIAAGLLVAATVAPAAHGPARHTAHPAPTSTSSSSSSTTPTTAAAVASSLIPPVSFDRTTSTTRASRSRARPREISRGVSVTAYCLTGRTADPHSTRPYRGSAAGNAWPFGTTLHLIGDGLDLTVVINDRIGHGSDVDVAMPAECAAARAFGRHTMVVVG